jgi:hypothetical protein
MLVYNINDCFTFFPLPSSYDITTNQNCFLPCIIHGIFLDIESTNKHLTINNKLKKTLFVTCMDAINKKGRVYKYQS